MQRFRPGLLALGLLCSCLAAQQPAASSAHAAGSDVVGLNRLQGMKVSDIQIHSPGSEHAEWLLALLEQKVNEPLDKYKVRRSVQALYNTGRFYRIDVEEKRDSAGGIILIFAAQGNFFFGSVKIEGAPAPPTENQLANASKLALGEQFSEAAVRTAIEGMQHVLQDNGYYKATIQPSYEWDAASQQVKVLFALNPGPRARIGKITITGTPDEKPEEVMDAIRLDGGDRVSAGSVTSALERLRRRYQKQGRLEAQAVLAKRAYHPENNTLDYTFDITRGPVVEVRVEGDGLSPKLIRKYVPIYEENAVDDDLLNEGRASIRDYLQTQGYFDAKVDYTLKNDSPDHLLVIFSIAKGERHKVLAIDITGNQYFPTATLRERLESQPAGGLLLNGTFSQSIAARDAESIESLYRNNGFLRVKVTPKVEDDYQGQSAHLKITMHIEEGPQITIRKLTITGNQAISMDEIRGLISATEGQPYSETAVANDQTQVVSEYFNRGFPNVRLENSAQPSANDPAKVDVTYKITEGQRVYVDKVLVSGLHFTRSSVVDREVKLNSGDPLNQNQMLETQRRLYDLGIFNSVDMAIQNPEGEDTHKNVSFQVEEARRYTFNYGVGFEVQTGEPAGSTQPKGQPGASARVSFDVTRLNFRGLDHTLTLKTRYGNLQKNVLVSYDAPRLFNSEKLTLNFTALYDDTFDVRTFEAKRLEGSGEIRQSVNRSTTLLYRFTYRRVSIPGGSLVIDPNLVPLFSQPVRVSLPSFTFIRDTRDDPINSHKGAFTSIDLGAASGIFGSQASFGRVVAQNSTYYQFHHKRWVFARSTRVGTEEKFGATTFIPLPERFLSGGSNSLRGFGLNQAGPRDLTTGFQLGGEALFVNNLELRTPPLPAPWAGNNLSAVVFHDMGNVFDSPQDAVHSLFRYSQPNRDSCLVPAAKNCSFNYVSHAVGSGIRYITPIGPLGVDVGYNLNPPLFPIAQQNRTDTLAHFNFFFTIGQTF
ncbi:MAG TPA: outer membrane protein assembly factor BamA [Candidatus Angelobacter sp.]|nr:outer membrane protein assembly factor BamA [Candidatus Angelobacter sp.]